MYSLALVPFFIQAICIGIDEVYFHYKRGLPKWEKIGHPIDTFSVLMCMYMVVFTDFNSLNIKIYIALSIFSCLMVTKDEFVHKHFCPAAENWLHALLFILHPITLSIAAIIWGHMHYYPFPSWIQLWLNHDSQILGKFIYIQTFIMSLFFVYQVIFWNFIWKNKTVIKH